MREKGRWNFWGPTPTKPLYKCSNVKTSSEKLEESASPPGAAQPNVIATVRAQTLQGAAVQARRGAGRRPGRLCVHVPFSMRVCMALIHV